MHYACMNKQIHIRDIEEQTHSRLVEKANAKGLSLSEFLRQELTQIAERKLSMAEFYALLRTREPVHLNPSAEEIIREDRDSRG